MRVSRRQVQRNVVPVVNLKVGRENATGVKYSYRKFWGGGWRRTYPADSFQSLRIDLVYVVDLRGGVVVVAVANDVDQVVVGEVGDDVAEVRESPGDRRLNQFTAVTSKSVTL